MEPMIIGATAPFVNGTQFHFYSAWLPRQGNAVRLSIEVYHGDDVKLTVQTKNREDTEATPPTDLANATGNTGIVTVRATDAKELVRYKVTTNPSQEMWAGVVHVRLLDPVWER